MDNLHVCIMAGGSGERFWPLSRKTTPKHLLKLFSDHTLVEETVLRVATLVPPERILILTNQAQLENTRANVPSLPPERIVAEPAKRDTAPACALGTAIARAADPNAVVVLLPADHIIKDAATFARQLREAAEAAETTGALVTFGIRPTFPATGFGYLKLGEPLERTGATTSFYRVESFVEKPDLDTAKHYLAQGDYAWNGGMFAWKADTFLKEARRHAPALATFIEGFPTDTAAQGAYLKEHFPELPKISVDYAIMEKAEEDVICARAAFDWDDVGTWTALPTHLGEDEHGNTKRGSVVVHDARNNIVFGDKRLVALCGVENLVVVETADAILVCTREAAEHIKKLHPQLPDEFL